eukprot:1370045-Amorphochlora_amoeboformis.AAC.1
MPRTPRTKTTNIRFLPFNCKSWQSLSIVPRIISGLKLSLEEEKDERKRLQYILKQDRAAAARARAARKSTDSSEGQETGSKDLTPLELSSGDPGYSGIEEVPHKVFHGVFLSQISHFLLASMQVGLKYRIYYQTDPSEVRRVQEEVEYLRRANSRLARKMQVELENLSNDHRVGEIVTLLSVVFVGMGAQLERVSSKHRFELKCLEEQLEANKHKTKPSDVRHDASTQGEEVKAADSELKRKNALLMAQLQAAQKVHFNSFMLFFVFQETTAR